MRQIILMILILTTFSAMAKEVRDTLYTRQGDKVILNYNISSDGDKISILMSKSRIIPTETLWKTCKGDLDKLKVVTFDKVGDYGKVKWSGLTPSAFMVPSGLSYDRSYDGYYIFGESAPIVFQNSGNASKEIRLPIYVALYEKKQSYKIIEPCTQPLSISLNSNTSRNVRLVQTGSEIERIAVHSSEEIEADNDEVTKALNSIRMIRQLLGNETELPFSQTLIMEVSNLRTIQDRVKDPEVLSKINDVFLEFDAKEKELRGAEKEALLSAQAQEQALIAQQKAEEEAKAKEAEEKERVREEKQHKRSFWMIVGGVILAILGFIGNAIFKHFRDIRNQKSIMDMQESLARQAQHEAGRRTREIVRNQAHQAVNKGKNKIRQSINGTDKTKNKTNRKSI